MTLLDDYFYWFGVVSTVLFSCLGLTVCASWAMDAIWRSYKDGYSMSELIEAMGDYRKKQAAKAGELGRNDV